MVLNDFLPSSEIAAEDCGVKQETEKQHTEAEGPQPATQVVAGISTTIALAPAARGEIEKDGALKKPGTKRRVDERSLAAQENGNLSSSDPGAAPSSPRRMLFSPNQTMPGLCRSRARKKKST